MMNSGSHKICTFSQKTQLHILRSEIMANITDFQASCKIAHVEEIFVGSSADIVADRRFKVDGDLHEIFI